MAGYEEDRERSLAGPTELRVHGVGGTPPENLLRDTAVLVAGTTTSGFYRRARERSTDPWQLEAYSWGGLTAGGGLLESLRKALWLLLLPFTLVNAAGWMMPRPKAGGGRYGWGQRLLRWLAQFATIGFALSLAAMSVDMIGLQCGSSAACADHQRWLQWIDFPWLRFIHGRPAGLMAVALLLPALALVALWFISRGSRRASEGVAHPFVADMPEDAGWRTSADAMNIARPELWGGRQRVLGMTRIHFGSAAAAVAAVYAAAVVWLDREAGGVPALTAVLGAWTVGVVVWGAYLLRKGGTPGVARGEPPGRWPQTRVLLWAGVGLAIVTVAVGWIEGPTWVEAAGVSPIDARTAFNWITLAASLPLAAIAIAGAVALLWRDVRARYGPAWLSAFLGLVAGVAFMAMLALWLANLLDSEEAPIDVWRAYEAAAVAVLVLIGVAVAATASHLVRLWWNSRRQECADRLDADYHADLVTMGENRPLDEFRQVPAADQGWLAGHQGWLRSRVREIRISQLTDDRVVQVARTLAATAVLFWLWAAIDIVVTLFTDTTAGFGSLLPAWGWVVTAARWVASTLLAAVFALIANGYRPRGRRNRVAVLWDVLTFWPRWFHPITPPSYAETAVPQLRDHIGDRHLREPVLLAAHSQGAVLAITTVARMESATARSSVALLTYGNPAERLYGRFFPAYFGMSELAKARELLTGADGAVRWRNLARCSDPIGGTVLVPDAHELCQPCREPPPRDTIIPPNPARRLNDVDWLVPDPHPVWPPRGDPLPGSRGHSDYDLDGPFDAAAEELFALLGVPAPVQP